MTQVITCTITLKLTAVCFYSKNIQRAMKLNDETNNWVDIIVKFNIVKSMVDIQEEEELIV